MKIIGNGLLAKTFLEYNKYSNIKCVIFASGVSNSNENDEINFLKEINLIKKTIVENGNEKLIYFSSIFLNRENPYYRHKIEIENLIKKNFIDFLIIRLPQLVGKGGNPNNIFNFFKEKIKKGELIHILDNSERSLIDVEDVRDFVIYCLENKISGTINFCSIEKVEVLKLAHLMAKKLNKNLYYKLLKNEEKSIIFDNSPEIDFFLDIKKIDKINYTDNLVKKYL